MTKPAKKSKQVKQGKRIRSGDHVMVIAGNDKGRTGEVLSRSADRVIVQGINIRKKHMKASQENPQGRIAEIEMAIHISNVQLCTPEGTTFKPRIRFNAEGAKEIYRKDGDNEVLHRATSKTK